MGKLTINSHVQLRNVSDYQRVRRVIAHKDALSGEISEVWSRHGNLRVRQPGFGEFRKAPVVVVIHSDHLAAVKAPAVAPTSGPCAALSHFLNSVDVNEEGRRTHSIPKILIFN